ncbi:MAG TPA: hypothetical protein VK639_01075 [Terriglobales bacterium]|nr:hypothetical protein [Terriglobales bacterium]
MGYGFFHRLDLPDDLGVFDDVGAPLGDGTHDAVGIGVGIPVPHDRLRLGDQVIRHEPRGVLGLRQVFCAHLARVAAGEQYLHVPISLGVAAILLKPLDGRPLCTCFLAAQQDVAAGKLQQYPASIPARAVRRHDKISTSP